MASSTNTSGMKYEVFLSFRGSDTRDNFTSCLYHDMVEKGIRVFKDDKELQVGDKIEELLGALDDSKIYIPIFSRDFASSKWCLREVARMVDCTSSKSDRKKEILPLFFDVEPEDVKLGTELYSNALSEHERKYGSSEVKRWRDALGEVATRVGWKVEGKDYGLHIKDIVRRVQVLLRVKNRDLPDHLVETDDLEEIEELLDVDSTDHVHFVILHGAAGIGKSTLAGFIFDQFRSKFEYDYFLKIDGYHSLLDMQKALLSNTLGSTAADVIRDKNDGKHNIERGLCKKKLLLVLDNADEVNQLENLAGSYDWFGRGSRIVVTVRDEGIIPVKIKERPSNYRCHQVKEMSLDQAIELFSKNAFKSEYPQNWYKLSKEVVLSIGSLPLALEIVGSLFYLKSGPNWNDTLDKLKDARNKTFRDKLKISVDKLDNIQRYIFLEIACFCIGEEKTKVSYVWDNLKHHKSSRAIEVLCERSLVKIDKNNKFWMHDELRDLGRCIVEAENLYDAGQRSWVWIDDDTSDVLTSKKEKPAVRALSLSPSTSHDFTPEKLARFPNLRFLGGEGMNFLGDFKDSLPNLRWLSWHNCQVELGETNLHLEKLVVLDLSRSSVTHDWGGWSQIKKAKKLKVLDLTACQELIQTPDFSEFGELEELVLAGCRRLSTIGSSIGELKKLRALNIEGCVKLEGFPEEISSLELLTEIILPSPGAKPFRLPRKLGNLKSLTRFDVGHHRGGRIMQLPASITELTNLTHLILRNCKHYLRDLPEFIGDLTSLVELDLERSGIEAIPDSIGKLKKLKVLRVGHTKIDRIPRSIGGVVKLEELHAQYLPNLTDEFLPELCSLTGLRILNLDQTRISTVPEEISGCSSLQTLIIKSHELRLLPKLPSSLECLLVLADEFPVLPDLSNLDRLKELEVQKFKSSYISWSNPEGLISPWEDAHSIDRLPYSLSIFRLEWIPQLPKFSKFETLSMLYIRGCPMQQFPELEYLKGLRELGISVCLLKSIPDLSRSTRLQKLKLSWLPELTEFPSLGELESLKFLDIVECEAIQQLPNLSKLKKLQHLRLRSCVKLKAIEGLRELNRLKTVEIVLCKSLERLPDLSVKPVTDWYSWNHGRF